MSKTVQALVALASIAIIVFVGFFFWSKLDQSRKDQALAAQMQAAKNAQELAICQDVVQAWDSGLKTYAKAHAPSNFDTYLDACRMLIEIDASK